MIVCLAVAAGSAMAQGAAPVARDGRVVCLTEHLEFARDPAGNAGIADRHALAWFKADYSAAEAPSFGYTPDAIWARVDIENVTDDDIDAILELSLARLKQVDWFVLDGERIVKKVSSGLSAGYGCEHQRDRYPFIDVVLPAGSVRTVYLRISSSTALWVPLKISAVSDYVRYAAKRDFMSHTFSGIGVAIFLLALFNAWLQRSRPFLLLSGTIAGFMGYYLIFHGYYVWLGGPLQIWVNRNLMIALALFGHWAFLAFTLDTANRDLREHWLLAFAGRFIWILPVGVALLLFLPFRPGVLTVLLCACHGLGVTIAFRSALTARTSVNWLLASVWGSVLLVVFLLVAGSFAWFPMPVAIVPLQRALMLVVFLVFFAIATLQQQAVRQEAERARRAEQLATEAQLSALRYQMNPHFLFNTLTSIEALSRKAPERIASLVRKLAVYLRLRLKPAGDGLAVFENEWASVRAYLDIEQVRFPDALRVQYHVSDAVLNGRVPDMLLQPLAENAIKHGMPEEGFLDMRFCAERKGAKLHIRVENSGRLRQGDPLSPDSGVGLENVKERLLRLYGDAASFALREEDGTVVAEIIMPFEALRG